MNPSSVLQPISSRQESRWGLSTRIIRHLLFSYLQGLKEGTLFIEDLSETLLFGSPAGAADLKASVRIHDARFYSTLLFGGNLGAAEGYMKGYWSCDDLTALFRIFARNMSLVDRMDSGFARLIGLAALAYRSLSRNSRKGSLKNIHRHYDLGNEFFGLFLDETMMYSAAYFERSGMTLYEAQETKLDLICRKLNLQPQDHVLEIGTGWGGFAIHAARKYGCRVTTTTISQEQYQLACRRIAEARLEDRIQVLLKDYRDLEGHFDKLVSIEMIEAVGYEYLDNYFSKCSELLKPQGMMLLQAITIADQRLEQHRKSVDFIQHYIFPGSFIPSLGAIQESLARVTDLRPIHLEDNAPHYARTLQLWRERFLENLDAVRQLGYPESFLRMWHYYLAYCEAGFAEWHTGSVQLLLAKPGSRWQGHCYLPCEMQSRS